MTFQDDPNRPPPADPILQRDVRRREVPDEVMAWGIPLAIAAVVLVAGLIFYNLGSGDQVTTAANNRAPITTNVPTQTPAPVPPLAPPKQ